MDDRGGAALGRGGLASIARWMAAATSAWLMPRRSGPNIHPATASPQAASAAAAIPSFFFCIFKEKDFSFFTSGVSAPGTRELL
jgi:hypothetical protein